MIVYIKDKSGEIYASPVFAEIGESWGIKSVVLDKTNTSLILLPFLIKGVNDGFNYFYIDETIESGWTKHTGISGFEEIIQNKSLIKALKQGESVPLDGLQIVKNYKLPLPVINKFEIKTESDIDTFNSVCWGLHDARVETINQVDNDVIINFDTTWRKHIIMCFHNAKEIHGIDSILDILDSSFKIENDRITWEAFGDFDDDDLNGQVYIIAQKITWELKID